MIGYNDLLLNQMLADFRACGYLIEIGAPNEIDILDPFTEKWMGSLAIEKSGVVFYCNDIRSIEDVCYRCRIQDALIIPQTRKVNIVYL